MKMKLYIQFDYSGEVLSKMGNNCPQPKKGTLYKGTL